MASSSKASFLSPATASRPRRLAWLIGVGLSLGLAGCGPFLRLGGLGAEAPPIHFAEGELHATEAHPLVEVERASRRAVERLGYESIEVDRSADRTSLQARTAGGDPVDLLLVARGPEETELRIRVGAFGDEAASRLVLEEIHQRL